MRAPMLFSSDYKHFYCQFSEPSYVKKLKLEMLTAIANESNTYEIVTELCEYVGNVGVPIARESIRAVGKIALQQYDLNAIVDRLLQFLEMDKEHVTAEALGRGVQNIIVHASKLQQCIAVVGNISSKNVQEPKAKSALIWMLGEYAQEMHDATYILESLIENWEEENAHEVRLHLLTATMKCFFKRPPETQKALGAALAAGLAESHQDVHDRALFYYRLLQCDASTAECVVNPPKQAVSVFADSQSSEIKDRVFDEFNTLSVVYQKPSYMFTDKEHQGPFEVSEEIINLSVGGESIENVIPAERYKETDNDLLLTTSEKEENGVSNTNGSTASGYIAPFDFNASLPALGPPTQSGPGNSNSGLPAIDDLLGLGALSSSVPAAPLPPSLMLNPKTALDPGTFQRKWGQLSASFSQECSMNPQGIATPTTPTPQALIPHMQGNYINCIASGGQPPNLKFFFYAQMLDGSSSFFLVECIINTASGKAQVKVRADDGSESEAFSTLFHSALLNLGLS